MEQGKYYVSVFGNPCGRFCHNEAEVKELLSTWYQQEIADGRFAKTKFGYVFVNDRLGVPEMAQIIKEGDIREYQENLRINDKVTPCHREEGGADTPPGDEKERRPMSEVKLTSYDYYPGDKWDLGRFEFEFETPLGALVYEESLPGPRHSEDSGELTVKLNGVDLSSWASEHEGVYPEFEAPGKSGRWSDQFAAGLEEEVKSTVEAWFEACKGELADFLAQRKS